MSLFVIKLVLQLVHEHLLLLSVHLVSHSSLVLCELCQSSAVIIVALLLSPLPLVLQSLSVSQLVEEVVFVVLLHGVLVRLPPGVINQQIRVFFVQLVLHRLVQRILISFLVHLVLQILDKRVFLALLLSLPLQQVIFIIQHLSDQVVLLRLFVSLHLLSLFLVISLVLDGILVDLQFIEISPPLVLQLFSEVLIDLVGELFVLFLLVSQVVELIPGHVVVHTIVANQVIGVGNVGSRD